MQDKESYYEQLADGYATIANRARARASRIAWLRLGYFLILICAIILLFQWQWMVAVVVFYAGIYGFRRIMDWHTFVDRTATVHERLVDLCGEEKAVLDLQLQERDTGSDFAKDNHDYSYDMDIFGRGSIYSLVSRCRTSLGRKYLADACLYVPDREVVDQRRQAAVTLEKHPEWMLRYQAEGYDIAENSADCTMLRQWLDEDSVLQGRSVLTYLSWLLPVVCTVAFAGLWYYYTFVIALIALVPTGFLLVKYNSHISQQQRTLDQLGSAMAGYSHMIAWVEQANFDEQYLDGLVQTIRSTPAASRSLLRLSRLIDNLHVRNNIFGVVLNFFTLWDLHYMRKLEQWRIQHREQAPRWIESIAEIELLVSIGTLGFHHPDWAIPTWTDQPMVSGQSLGHPLLDQQVRITNDYQSPSTQHVDLLTGSNMGGKSTFLRTIGLQIIFTYLGARTCADSWSMPYGVQLYTSMRTQDAIQESVSGFYAELRRLEQLIGRVESGEPIFYLLDEVLKGTNSKDRNRGAAALIRQLVQHGSAGMISTHDTSLHVLEEELPGRMTNKCFEVLVDGDQLTFDYRLRDGVSKSFNATALMRQIGIEV